MRVLLIANTIFELIVAAVVIFAPNVIAPDASPTMSRVLGGNALGLAALSWFMRDSTDRASLRAGLISLSVFHGAVTVAQLVNVIEGNVPWPVLIIHGTFAAAFLFFLLKQR